MSAYTTSTRWWENYLVRYFMPSIAGMVAVSWIVSQADPELGELLRLGAPLDEFGTAALLQLFLYGNLFCYVASYPILTFHVTRVIDFSGAELRWQWKSFLLDGYVATVVLAIAVMAGSLFSQGETRYRFAFGATLIFAVIQLVRLRRALVPRLEVSGLREKGSRMFAFAYSLARRRGLRQETQVERKAVVHASVLGQTVAAEVVGRVDDERMNPAMTKVIEWRPELIDTYRHMREHGNSAFIFVLELILTGLAFCGLSISETDGSKQLSVVAILFGIWALPAMFVHLAGQQLERRFSNFDRRFLKGDSTEGG